MAGLVIKQIYKEARAVDNHRKFQVVKKKCEICALGSYCLTSLRDLLSISNHSDVCLDITSIAQ